MPSPHQIRAARALLNWSQGDLAARVGITQRAITDIETGKSRGNATNLKIIADVFQKAGIDFIENGARIKSDKFTVISGPHFVHKGMDYILDTVNKVFERGVWRDGF